MSRVNDVGGQEGFGPVAVTDDEPPFHADWEARVFALNASLLRAGHYTLDEFRDAIERMPPQAYLAASYYERWFAAIRTLVVDKGLLTAEDVESAGGTPATPGESAGGTPATPGEVVLGG